MKALPSTTTQYAADDVALAKRLYMWLSVVCIVIGISVALYYGVIAGNGTRRVCPLLNLTGVPCPSCGGSRAFGHLFAGDIAASVALNPNALLVAVVLLATIAMVLYDFVAATTPLLRRRMLLPRIYRFFASPQSWTSGQKRAVAAVVIVGIVFEALVWWRNIYLGI